MSVFPSHISSILNWNVYFSFILQVLYLPLLFTYNFFCGPPSLLHQTICLLASTSIPQLHILGCGYRKIYSLSGWLGFQLSVLKSSFHPFPLPLSNSLTSSTPPPPPPTCSLYLLPLHLFATNHEWTHQNDKRWNVMKGGLRGSGQTTCKPW